MLVQMQNIMKEFIKITKKLSQQKNRGRLWNISKKGIYTWKTLPVQINNFGDKYMKLLMIYILRQ